MDVPVLRKIASDIHGADVAALMEVRGSAIVTLGMFLQTLWEESILWAWGWRYHRACQYCWSMDGIGFTPYFHLAASQTLLPPKKSVMLE